MDRREIPRRAIGKFARFAWSVHLRPASLTVPRCVNVEDVKFVINFDYPSSSEDYVHRIGRTGRSQRTGTAYTFFTPGNARQASDLVAVLREANQVINPKLYEMAEVSKGLGGRGRNRWRGRDRDRERDRDRDRDRGARGFGGRSRSRSHSRNEYVIGNSYWSSATGER
ncbi:probable ATP-dependent RNA helicase DDX5 [Zootermopsis nevadensis]|uniref:probable ATP-dependent RNA helicase DDX5 n=1 Tax=Zootermopsis nevadensis TaxID=136037 RepID=UPI000B8E6F44|nr:probable ATP-dependent RNA helicase DDX5 [Zootermopsis nevadensis]